MLDVKMLKTKMPETKVLDENKRDNELMEVVNRKSFSNVASSNMQEGGWKNPDINQGRQQDNQIELMEFAVVLTLWNSNRLALSYLQIQRNISDKQTVKFHYLQSNLGACPKY